MEIQGYFRQIVIFVGSAYFFNNILSFYTV